MHALNDWTNEFLRIIDIIDNFTKHPHLYKQPPSASVKSLKKKMEKLQRKYVFAPADKAANNVIIIWKRHYPYQSEKFAASLPQTCSTLFSAPEKLRNSVQRCAASGTLLAHNRLCATESKVVRQNWNCVREVCHNIFLV